MKASALTIPQMTFTETIELRPGEIARYEVEIKPVPNACTTCTLTCNAKVARSGDSLPGRLRFTGHKKTDYAYPNVYSNPTLCSGNTVDFGAFRDTGA